MTAASRARLAVIAALLGAPVSQSPAADAQPRLHTHQAYIEEVTRPAELDVGDPMAVFAFVINSLPDRVKVYPTESYFYFSFISGGVPYAGNIRLDASNRDDGKVSFAYFEKTTGWRDETPGKYRLLDESNGVVLQRLDRFVYRLSFRDKQVVFELNDLSQVKPPAAAIAPGETYIGPIFDDSGIRFFLVYNTTIKDFLYVLDETVKVAEPLEPGKQADRMLTGKRTGFVYYRDHRRDRKILIGVYGYNAAMNNYFDGPFDQLPDNFIKGEELRNAILEVDPSLKGKIDRYGGSPDGLIRFMIAPYREYELGRELDPVDRCATRRRALAEARYYRCFSANLVPDTGRRTLPQGRPAEPRR